MKKLLSFLLATMLCVCLLPSLAEGNPETLTMEKTGITLTLPESMRNAKGGIRAFDNGETATGSGIYASSVIYIPQDTEEIQALLDELAKIDPEDPNALTDPENLQIYMSYVNMLATVKPICQFITTGGGKTLEEMPAELFSDSMDSYDIHLIGTVGDYHCYMLILKQDSEEFKAISLDEEFMQEFEALTGDPESILANITLSEPVIKEQEAATDVISFQATDMDGNPVDLAEVFAQHEVTMVNFWGTFCGPCKAEMPELEKMNLEMNEKDCAIIGVCIDVESGNTEKARDILANAGVTYLNLVPEEDLLTLLKITTIPTSYFVNREGKIVTEPIVGAYLDAYKSMFDKALEAGANSDTGSQP